MASSQEYKKPFFTAYRKPASYPRNYTYRYAARKPSYYPRKSYAKKTYRSVSAPESKEIKEPSSRPIAAMGPIVEEYKKSRVLVETKGLLGTTYSTDPSTEPLLKAAKMAANIFGSRKVFHIKIGAVLSMSTSGAGIVNSVITNGTALYGTSEFSALASIFDEFFVVGFDINYVPLSRYNLMPTQTTNQNSSTPLGVCQIQNGEASYTSISGMANNQTVKYHTSSDPWKFSWRNVQRWKNGTMSVQAQVPTTFTQDWANCASVISGTQTYNGFVQILSTSNTQTLPISTQIGDFLVSWDIRWRCRS